MGSGPRESRYDAWSWDETDDDVVVDEGITEDGANAMTDEAETAANRADTSFMFAVRWVVSGKCILPVPRVSLLGGTLLITTIRFNGTVEGKETQP